MGTDTPGGGMGLSECETDGCILRLVTSGGGVMVEKWNRFSYTGAQNVFLQQTLHHLKVCLIGRRVESS